MHGNASEWCWDRYGDYTAGRTKNPVGPWTGAKHVSRGGNWGNSARFCRAASRRGLDPTDANSIVGFRVVLAPEIALLALAELAPSEGGSSVPSAKGAPAGPVSGEGWRVPDLGLALMPIKRAGKFVLLGGRHVELTKPFWLGKYEVTQPEFAVFVLGTGHKTRDLLHGYKKVEKTGTVWQSAFLGEELHGYENVKKTGALWQSAFPGKNRPVVCISWLDAAAFCIWLTARERRAGRLPSGYEYRLPTEVEWEYASGATFWDSGCCRPRHRRDALDEHAWHRGNSRGRTHDVGQKRPNVWGLYDMHGNVSEWCLDRWRDMSQYIHWIQFKDYVGRGGHLSIYRGGGYNSDARGCDPSKRYGQSPHYMSYTSGFRVALAPAREVNPISF